MKREGRAGITLRKPLKLSLPKKRKERGTEKNCDTTRTVNAIKKIAREDQVSSSSSSSSSSDLSSSSSDEKAHNHQEDKKERRLDRIHKSDVVRSKDVAYVKRHEPKGQWLADSGGDDDDYENDYDPTDFFIDDDEDDDDNTTNMTGSSMASISESMVDQLETLLSQRNKQRLLMYREECKRNEQFCADIRSLMSDYTQQCNTAMKTIACQSCNPSKQTRKSLEK